MRESAKYQIPFFKKNWKSKFKIPEFEKKVKPGRKKSYLVEGNLYGKLLKKFLFKSDLKELVTNYRFVSSDRKVKFKFHVRYFSDKKICSSVVNNLISTLR